MVKPMLIMHALLLCSFVVCAPNEFVQKKRPTRVSVSKMREDAADELSKQLRLSAQLINAIGSIQMLLAQHGPFDEAKEQNIIDTVQQAFSDYALQLAHLHELGTIKNCLRFKYSSLNELLAVTIKHIGSVQQQVIKHLEDIFENKSDIFCKNYRLQLPDVLKTIKLYTKQFYVLKDALDAVHKQLVHGQKKKEHAMVTRACTPD